MLVDALETVQLHGPEQDGWAKRSIERDSNVPELEAGLQLPSYVRLVRRRERLDAASMDCSLCPRRRNFMRRVFRRRAP